MAILAIFTGKGITRDMYEALRKEVNWEGDQPAGGIFHAMGLDEEGHLHVADVWASPEQMDAFVQQRLLPGMQKHNVPPPDVAVYPLYNANAYKAIEQYRI